MPRAKRGEIWLIDLGLVQKARPCLVLSVDFLEHERAVVTYIPRTTVLRGTRFEVPHQGRGHVGDQLNAPSASRQRRPLTGCRCCRPRG